MSPFPKPFDAWYASSIGLIPLLALILAALFLYNGQARIKQKPAASLILSGVLYGSAFFTIAKKTDYHQVTEMRAATVARAVDPYYARQGGYPQSLRQLVPWTVLALPKPVVLHGQDWCYQSGEGYYRLGYVSRDQWSSPYLRVRVNTSAGAPPELPALCQSETDAILSVGSEYELFWTKQVRV